MKRQYLSASGISFENPLKICGVERKTTNVCIFRAIVNGNVQRIR